MTPFQLDLLDMFKKARIFPDLFQQTDVTIVFTLGEDDAGYVVGTKSSPLQSSALDLTGASVKLIARRIPGRPSVMLLAGGYSGFAPDMIFNISGTITDAVNGVVQFDLSSGDLDSRGEFLMEIEINTSASKRIIPIQYRFKLRPRLNT